MFYPAKPTTQIKEELTFIKDKKCCEQERKYYTQKLFTKFMRKSQTQPYYGYVCEGAIVLTTDQEVYDKLRIPDCKRYWFTDNYIYSLETLGIKLCENSKLCSNIKNAMLFSSMKEQGSTDTSEGGEYTLLLIYSEKDFNRFEELFLTVFQHHIDENKIDVEGPFYKEVPLLHVEFSRNNECMKLESDGYFCDIFDMRIMGGLHLELDNLAPTNPNSEEEHTL